MKIAVAGGKGFIGKPLIEAFAVQGHDVESWDLPEVNLLDRSSIARSVAAFKPDVIVNLAAVLGGMNSKNTHDIFSVNFYGNLNLVEEAKKAGVAKYVFASSLTVHGSNDPASPVRLSSPFYPRHAYGASKASSEFALREYAKQGMTVVALRPTIILGDTKIDHAPIDFIKTISAGRKIEIFGTGEHEREWIWIDDTVEGFLKAISWCVDHEQGYFPFFLSGNRIRMKDLAEDIASRLGGHVIYVPSQSQAFSLTCDMTESASLLRWQVRHDMNGMVLKLIELLKPHD